MHFIENEHIISREIRIRVELIEHDPFGDVRKFGLTTERTIISDVIANLVTAFGAVKFGHPFCEQCCSLTPRL